MGWCRQRFSSEGSWMKRYREFREDCIILEHPNLKARIIAKINPMDAIRDKMDDLKEIARQIKR